MNVIKLLGLAAVAVTMVACSSNNGQNAQTMYYNQCFNVAVDHASGATVIDDEVAYTLVLNFDDYTIDITAQSLQISPNGGNATVNFGKIPFTYNNDLEAITASAASLSTSGQVSVSDLHFVYSFRTVKSGGQYVDAPIITLNYLVNNSIRVTAYMNQYIYVNDYTVSTTSDGSYNQSADVIYTVTFKEPRKQEAVVAMDGVKYADDMNALQLIVPNVPVAFSESGYTLSADNVVPKQYVDGSEKEAKEYEMKDFGLDARFVTKKDEIPAHLAYDVVGKYTVHTALKYYQNLTSED